MNAHVRLDHTLIAVDHDETLHVMLEIEPPEAEVSHEGKPLTISLVLDRSGSMQGDKIAVARSCARWLAERLSASGRMALVAFDHEVSVLAVPGDKLEKIAGALRFVHARGSTNLSGGWLKGLELVQDGDGPRRVILLTDGLANHGIVDHERIVSLTEGAHRRGVTTTTIGLGDDFDEELLTRMADAGGGNAHFASSPEDAPEVFGDEADDLAALVAQNVSVEILPTSFVAQVDILGDYPAAATADGVRIELGDAYAGRGRRLVMRIDVPRLPSIGARRIAEIVLRYTAIGDEITQHTIEMPVVVNVGSPEEARVAGIDMEVQEEVAVLSAAKAQKDAAEEAERGNFEGARTMLHGAAEQLRTVAGWSENPDELLAEADAIMGSADLAQRSTWDAKAKKDLHYRSHRSQRGKGDRHSNRPASGEGGSA